MKIVLASEVIHPGGAETFILRLAQALHNNGHDVRVFVFYNQLLNYELCRLIAPDVQVTPAAIPVYKLLSKIDGLLFRLKIDISLRDSYIRKTLNKLIKEQGTEVIHSHLLKVDKLCLDVCTPLNIPVVNTIHGDYLQFFNKTKNNIPIPLLNYPTKAPHNLQRLAATVCISDKQTAFFKEHFPNETANKISKIYNGYTGEVTEQPDVLKQQLGINDTDFVFGMVSRGIPEKGWQVAINGFLKMNNTKSHLVLTGESGYLSDLKEKYSTEKRIHFTGHSDNPINWINIFDVGLLPSTYPSESLPTVIIEYLYCHVPVIASDAGEIVNMTGQAQHPAGQIVAIDNGEVSVDKIAAAMKRYLDTPALYDEHKNNTGLCYRMFDMNKCVEAYTEVYQKAINR
ncbi:MAG: glycosyltransferase family 4 protein [Chitinophagales bacterium]|nr:glycosyltransferase family 4 protein [Chitinophagales bacterium]